MATTEFSLDLFAPDRARRMLEHWHAVLLDVAVNPARPVAEISLLAPAEKHRVLVEWNRTEGDYPRDKFIHEVFEKQAERTPDAVVVVFEGNSLSYQELNSRANRLLHHWRWPAIRHWMHRLPVARGCPLSRELHLADVDAGRFGEHRGFFFSGQHPKLSSFLRLGQSNEHF